MHAHGSVDALVDRDIASARVDLRSLKGVDICEYKEVFLEILGIIVQLLPGAVGAVLGPIIVKYAERWFAAHCPP